MTSRTASRRAGRSDSGGSSNRTFAAARVRLARTMRWAIVARGSEERPGDVVGAQAADQLEGERGARVRRQDRVAGHEDQPEQVVGQVAVDDLVEVVLRCSAAVRRPPGGTCRAGCPGGGSGRRPGSARSCSARRPGCRVRRPVATSRSPPRRRPGRAPRRCRGRRPAASAGRSRAGTRPATASPPGRAVPLVEVSQSGRHAL